MLSNPVKYPERWCRIFVFKIVRLRQTGTENRVRSRMAPTRLSSEKRHIRSITVFRHHPMATDRRAPVDRRAGRDRRQDEKGPPTNFERRRTVEARQPELTELDVSDEELKALGFGRDEAPPKKPD